jgi:hypothetical protein
VRAPFILCGGMFGSGSARKVNLRTLRFPDLARLKKRVILVCPGICLMATRDVGGSLCTSIRGRAGCAACEAVNTAG